MKTCKGFTKTRLNGTLSKDVKWGVGVDGASFNGFVNDESLWNLFWCFLCKFYYRNRPILKTLGQFQNLGFVIMSTRENIRLIARTPFSWVENRKNSGHCLAVLWWSSEMIFLQVSNRNINDRVLKFSVYDVDRHKKHQVIGHALYPLKDHDCESNERLVIWRDLEREVLEVMA